MTDTHAAECASEWLSGYLMGAIAGHAPPEGVDAWLVICDALEEKAELARPINPKLAGMGMDAAAKIRAAIQRGQRVASQMVIDDSGVH